jgi:hypothetical protein
VRPNHPNPNANNQFPLNQIDANHGPVTSVRVLRIVGDKSARIQFSITMCLPYCDVPGATRGGIISFRFWIGENIDCTDWTTERVYHGRVRVAHLGHNVLLEFRRNFGFPTLHGNFMRRRITLNQSPNGLELEFTITDKEVWAVAPPPATDWEGYHAITSPQPGGALLTSEVSLSLKGPRTVPTRGLIRLVQRIMHAKLHIDDLAKNGSTFLQFLSFRHHMKDNRVDATAVVKMTAPDHETLMWNVADLDKTFGLTLDKGFIRLTDYNHGKAVNAYPTATLKGLFLAFLNDPCHVLGWPPDAPEEASQRSQQGAPLELVDQGATLLQSPGRKYSTEHNEQGAYNIYRMSSELDADDGKIYLPVGRRKNATDPGTVVISLHGGAARRTVRLEAERLNAWPTVPQPVDFTAGTIGHTLLEHKLYPSAPQLSQDGRKSMYHIVCMYRFGLDRMPDYSKGEIPAALARYRVEGQDKVFLIPADVFKDPKGILYKQ